MPKPFVYPVPDFGAGSLNEGLPFRNIADNEYPEISNFTPSRGGLHRRGGTSRLSEYAQTAGQPLTGLFRYVRPTLVQTLVAGGRRGLFRKLNDPTALGAMVAMAHTGGFTITDSDALWTILQYKDVLYWLRADLPNMLRGRDDFAEVAGLLPPSAAPVLADGAAGQIPAASFKGVMTCYDTLSGDESNPSDVSNTLAHAANKKIAWSSLAICTRYANARRLYRTLPDQTGAYFRVVTIDNSSSSYAEDNSLVEQLGPAVSFNNGTPPLNLRQGDVWREHLFATDGKSLYFSQPGMMSQFGALDIIEVFPDDGGELIGVRAHGDRLLIGKTNGMHFLLGTDRSNFELHTLSNKHGLAAAHSLQVFEGLAMWYGGDNFYISDGNAVEAVSKGTKIRDFINGIPDERKKFVTAAVLPEENQYIATISFEEPSAKQHVGLIYNYKTDAWTTFNARTGDVAYPPLGDDLSELADGAYHAPTIMIPVGDGSGRLFATFGLTAGVWDSGLIYLTLDMDVKKDLTHPIDAVVRTKAFTLGLTDAYLGLRRVGLAFGTIGDPFGIPAEVDLTLFGGHIAENSGLEVVTTRTVRLDARPDAMKWINLSTLGDPRADIMVRLLYQEEQPMAIQSLSLDGVVIRRRGQPI